MSLATKPSPTPVPVSNKPNVISIESELRPLFQAEAYQIQQPYFQITKEGYDIVSTNLKEKFSAVRPRAIFKNLVASGMGFAAFFVAFTVVAVGIPLIASSIGLNLKSPVLTLLITVVAVVGGVFAAISTNRAIAPKRRLTVFDSSPSKKALMTIEPASGLFIFNHEYRLLDSTGRVQVYFRKNFIDSIFRIHWHCHDNRGKYLFSAIEDSLILALMRRYLNLGRLIPLQFNFAKMGGKPFGKFIRRFSVRDKYKLSHNPAVVDSWLIVASALLLDTGENR